MKRTTLPRMNTSARPERLPFLVGAALHTHERAAQLTLEQADGIACIRCGRTDTTMQPAGTRDGVQLFACTPACLTDAQRTLTYDADLGSHRTAPIESPMRDIDDQYTAAENAAVPLFTAEVVVTDWKALEPAEVDGRFRSGGTVDGRFTEMWVSHGHTTGTVTPAKGREIAQAMRDFAARLDALCDRADEIAADDFQALG